MSTGVFPSPDLHGLEKSMSELYGIQHVGLVQIQSRDQASKNLASHIFGSERVYGMFTSRSNSSQHASIKKEHLCCKAHIVYFRLKKDGFISLPKAYSVYALQLRFPELPKMEAVDSALVKTEEKKKGIFNITKKKKNFFQSFFFLITSNALVLE